MLKYAAIYERTSNNYGVFSPDVPGCAATAGTWSHAKRLFVQALEVYIESCVEMGEQVPSPRLSLTEAIEFYAAEVTDKWAGSEVLEVAFSWEEVDVPDYGPASPPPLGSSALMRSR